MRSQQKLVVIDGLRTPFLRAGTGFAGTPADELGRMALVALLAKTGLDPARIDEVILGCVGQPPDTANIARVIALRAGVPASVPAVTVNRNCASGFESITTAWDRVQSGRGEVFVVGGVESMSSFPLLYGPRSARAFTRLARAKSLGQKIAALLSIPPSDLLRPRSALKLGLTDPVSGLNMGETAELIGREAGITRAQADAYAAASHRRALAAREFLGNEIAPAYVGPEFSSPILADNGPRPDATEEKLATLRPAFERGTGRVTAGNASQVSDGAVMLLVMSEAKAAELGYHHPLGVLGPFTYAACDPSRMGLGPVFAFHKLEKAGAPAAASADLVEINEAFATQVLACQARMGDAAWCAEHLGRSGAMGAIPAERLNVNGGAIALGHPVGASGARLVLTALRELRRRRGRRALISTCIGGGQGAAGWLFRE